MEVDDDSRHEEGIREIVRNVLFLKSKEDRLQGKGLGVIRDTLQRFATSREHAWDTDNRFGNVWCGRHKIVTCTNGIVEYDAQKESLE
eukprot:5142995-Amphidinium_carterae.3